MAPPRNAEGDGCAATADWSAGTPHRASPTTTANQSPSPSPTADYFPPPPPLPPWESVLFAAWPYSGGEAAIWTERMDGTNVVARAWPRTALVADTLWSQSMALHRVGTSMTHASASSVHGGGGGSVSTDGSPGVDWLQYAVEARDDGPLAGMHALTSLRLMSFTRSLWALGVAASPVAVFDLLPREEGGVAPGMRPLSLQRQWGQWEAAAAPPSLSPTPPVIAAGRSTGDVGGSLPRLAPLSSAGSVIPFNALTTGIEQLLQRRPADIPASSGEATAGCTGDTVNASATSPPSSCASKPSATLRFVVWNIANGGTARRRLRELKRRQQQGGAVEDALNNNVSTSSSNDDLPSSGGGALYRVGDIRDDNDDGGKQQEHPHLGDDPSHSSPSAFSRQQAGASRRLSAPAGARYDGILTWLRTHGEKYDVVALVEALGWDAASPLARRAEAAEAESAAAAAEEEEEMAVAHDSESDTSHDNSGGRYGGDTSNSSSAAQPRAWGRARLAAATAAAPIPLAAPPDGFSFSSHSFRRRAAAAGYAYSHLLHSDSGFHIALLSSAPLTPVYEVRGGAFQRGAMAVDSHGVRWLLAHLHAHDPRPRRDEAAWLAHLGRAYTAAGVPTVLAGDFNSLSPVDAGCHAALGVPAWLGGVGTPSYLRNKWRVKRGDEDGGGGACVASTNTIDYRPMAALLAPIPGGNSAVSSNNSGSGLFIGVGGGCSVPLLGPFYDAVVPSPLLPLPFSSRREGGNNSFIGGGGAPASASISSMCAAIGSIPTQFDVDPVGTREPPLRIDNVLVNSVMRARWAGPCRVLSDDGVAGGLSDHYPVECEWFLSRS